jgi:hypothetical protein
LCTTPRRCRTSPVVSTAAETVQSWGWMCPSTAQRREGALTREIRWDIKRRNRSTKIVPWISKIATAEIACHSTSSRLGSPLSLQHTDARPQLPPEHSRYDPWYNLYVRTACVRQIMDQHIRNMAGSHETEEHNSTKGKLGSCCRRRRPATASVAARAASRTLACRLASESHYLNSSSLPLHPPIN